MTSEKGLGLLLLHALPFDGEMWSAQMSLLPNHTYAPNLYDFGSNIEIWAKKSLELISEPNLIVVGCSLGGSCAVEVAKLAPERIAALVLIGTKPGHDPDATLYQSSIEFVERHGVQNAWERYWAPLFEKGRDDGVAQCACEIASRLSVEQLTNGLSAFHTRPDREELLASFGFPVHVVTGVEDRFPGLKYSQKLAEIAPVGILHLVNACGHYVPMVKSQELNGLLDAIVREHTGLSSVTK